MRLRRIIVLRVATLVCSMTLLVCLAYSLFALYHHRETAVGTWKNRVEILADGMEQLVLWDDRVAINTLVQREVASSPHLAYAFLASEGVPYLSSFTSGVPAALLQRPVSSEQATEWEYTTTGGEVLYDIAAPVGSGPMQLHLGVKRRQLDRDVTSTHLANLVVALLICGTGILLAMVIARRTTREVDLLSSTLIQYGEMAGSDELLEHAESTEVSALVSSFKQLSKERRQALEELQQLNEELEERVRERTAQLTAANEELNAFAYSVSHDLRAPLRGIEGFSLALLEDYGEKLDSQAKDYLTRIRNGCVRMGKLIDALLQLSRITRSTMHRQPVDLTALAWQVVADLQQQEPSRQVRVTIAPLTPVIADPNLLRIVLDNLVGNAWKFTRGTPGASISVGSRREGSETVFFVEDNGAGFDMRYADRLFNAFQRLHKAEQFEGTGIGLATVHRIIQRHGGRTWAEGAPGAGATFYFTLGTEG